MLNYFFFLNPNLTVKSFVLNYENCFLATSTYLTENTHTPVTVVALTAKVEERLPHK
jgi:hypothetical protein